MSRRMRGHLGWSLWLCAVGCAGSAAPDPDLLTDLLSALVLAPHRDCADLRRSFRLDHVRLVADPGAIGLVYEEVFVANARGAPICIWYLPATLDRGLVVFSHGAAGTLPCYIFNARMLVDLGWSVAMYEYQGFGRSGGTASLESLHGDLEAALNWALERSGRRRATLMGVSLGTIPSVSVAVEHPDRVNGVILDSPVALGEELDRFALLLGGNPQRYVSRLDPRLVTEEIIGQLGQPLLILVGELDGLTPPQMARLLYERAGGPKQIVVFPDQLHAHSPYYDTDEYLFHVESFLSSLPWEPRSRAAGRP